MLRLTSRTFVSLPKPYIDKLDKLFPANGQHIHSGAQMYTQLKPTLLCVKCMSVLDAIRMPYETCNRCNTALITYRGPLFLNGSFTLYNDDVMSGHLDYITSYGGIEVTHNMIMTNVWWLALINNKFSESNYSGFVRVSAKTNLNKPSVVVPITMYQAARLELVSMVIHNFEKQVAKGKKVTPEPVMTYTDLFSGSVPELDAMLLKGRNPKVSYAVTYSKV